MIQNDQRLSGFHGGDVILRDDAEYCGTVRGTITVAPGRRLRFRGVLGNLIIQKDAFVVLHGRVPGLVLNDGGTVTVIGSANVITDAAGCRALLAQAPQDAVTETHRTMLAYLSGRDAGGKDEAAAPRPERANFQKGLASGWKVHNADPPPPVRAAKKPRGGWESWIEEPVTTPRRR